MRGLSPEVERWLRGVPRERVAIVRALRGVVRRAAPKATETRAWDALSYHRPWVGGKVRGGVCQIVVRRGLVRLDFVHGASLPDPARLLRGDGAAKRFVPIGSVADASRREVAALVRAAARYEPGGAAPGR